MVRIIYAHWIWDGKMNIAAKQSSLTPAKRAINITMSADIIADAKALGINVSQVCERGLAEEIRETRNARWRAENREAIEASNAWVEEHGLPLARYRLF
jgi:antitoxin CcdA